MACWRLLGGGGALRDNYAAQNGNRSNRHSQSEGLSHNQDRPDQGE